MVYQCKFSQSFIGLVRNRTYSLVFMQYQGYFTNTLLTLHFPNGNDSHHDLSQDIDLPQVIFLTGLRENINPPVH